MQKKLILLLAAFLLMPRPGHAEDAKATLDGVVKAMGNVKAIQYSGSGFNYAFGQSVAPGKPYPKFIVKSLTRTINYETPALRDEIVRTQAEPGARGGGGLPLPGDQKQILAVAGTSAWTQVGEAPPTPAIPAVADRLHQLWITPHGVIKAAAKYNATAESKTDGGKKITVISFAVPDMLKVKASINERNLVEKVESWNPNPVLGDMLTETIYADYKDFGGVQFPTKITQQQAGFPTLELTVSEVKPNVPADIQAPADIVQATVKVATDKIAEGVWYLTGGTHHSVIVEMNDHLVVIEGPLDDARALAVIAEAKKLVPNKPIKYLAHTHHHFDHTGGLGAFAAEGAIIVTHDVNKPFLEQSLAAPRTVRPDKLAQSGKKPVVEGMQDKRVLSDGTRSVELHLIKETLHHDGIIMAYLPKEKILVEADVFTPAAPNATPPAQPSPLNVNLLENLERLKLDVDQILPAHGRKATLADLKKWIGKAS